MSRAEHVIYAVALDWLTGRVGPAPDNVDYLEWYAALPAMPVLTLAELGHVLTAGRLVPHHTYSMQQESFVRAGFEVTASPWKVRLPVGSLVVGLGARDRYDIFACPGDYDVWTFESVEEWRAGRDPEQEGFA